MWGEGEEAEGWACPAPLVPSLKSASHAQGAEQSSGTVELHKQSRSGRGPCVAAANDAGFVVPTTVAWCSVDAAHWAGCLLGGVASRSG
jgi:hypothetical protein